MNQNLWLKYAVYSFLGVLILIAGTGLMQNSMNDNGMSSMNNMNMQEQAQMPMQGMATSMGFAGGMPMSSMQFLMQVPIQGMATSMEFAGGMPMSNMQLPMQVPLQGMAINIGLVGEMPMNGIIAVYPLNRSIMSAIPVGRSYTPVYNQFVNNGIPVNSIQVGGIVRIPVNTVIAPMYGATMNSMPSLVFNSLPMNGM